ncbi:glucose-1-phosphate adenylyltransferase [Planococcus halocryophilus]|uniref:glucose-1-phosphate adenylyltransferase n=1 Tax=Planococcus halocryophilus TaxID=1215089 RepID=UPI001F0CF125|nr:glucose-1-phosphate adenylyltransferase [Planococcus halocryophilus]MCH4826418.1 glucose-1-phosphate adenylyltransferase [Planococcus halocryophilus]
MNNKVVAMLLAGGQGSRLKSLTYTIAKPALPFGGKYRIIDFPLSNCTNSGIETVGVLTQYQPHVLHSYIGLGTPWDLDRRHGGVTMLPPFAEIDGNKWYAGTASAIYQNITFLQSCDPEYVLILSGDHIYKMDYEVLVDYHKEHDADVTISVLEVPWEEASRFGVINVDDQMKVLEFDEKPENPKSNLASMGVYVFTWKKLKEYLEADNLIEESSHDFGKDILPAMMENGEKMIAYPFKGYWKDVGTVDSFWEANMDLLDLNSGLNLHDSGWRIYSSNPQLPPQVINRTGNVQSSMVNEGCVISGEVTKSIIFQKVVVEENAQISESVIMSGATVHKGAKLHRAIVPPGFEVPEGFEIIDQQDKVVLLTDEEVEKWKERGEQ